MNPVQHGDIRHDIRQAGLAILATLTAGVVLSARPAAAQANVVTLPAQQLSFTRPESWTLAHFTAATLLSGLETPATRKPGDVSIGLELGWLPRLDSAQLRV